MINKQFYFNSFFKNNDTKIVIFQIFCYAIFHLSTNSYLCKGIFYQKEIFYRD